MSHREAIRFFELVAAANSHLIATARILEIGSCDVNGGVRSIFSKAELYLGIDVVSGPGVDEVCLGHEFAAPANSFDIVVSSECLEHDPYWQLTVRNMIRLTRPGGIVAISCASKGRVEHGTLRTRPLDSPGSIHLGNHYENIDLAKMRETTLAMGSANDSVLVYNRFSCDLYFAGRKAGLIGDFPTLNIPSKSDIEEIAQETRIHTHLRRLPSYLLRTIPMGERRYQSISILMGKLIQRMRRVNRTYL